MRYSARWPGAILGASAAALVLLASATAAPPANDTFAGAVTIPSLPLSQTVNTTEATTDALDAEVNANCGAPATDASVWYAFTPTANMDVFVGWSGAILARVLVATGAPGSFSLVTCGHGAIFAAAAGTTYYLLVVDDQLDGGRNGGSLEISVSEVRLRLRRLRRLLLRLRLRRLRPASASAASAAASASASAAASSSASASRAVAHN